MWLIPVDILILCVCAAGVFSAVDTASSRLYIDMRCVTSRRPMIDGGKHDTRGSVQVMHADYTVVQILEYWSINIVSFCFMYYFCIGVSSIPVWDVCIITWSSRVQGNSYMHFEELSLFYRTYNPVGCRNIWVSLQAKTWGCECLLVKSSLSRFNKEGKSLCTSSHTWNSMWFSFKI